MPTDVDDCQKHTETQMSGSTPPSGTSNSDVQAALDAAVAQANQMTIMTAKFSGEMSAVNAKNHAAKQIVQ